MHVLGVYPCSQQSADEAETLIEAVRPSVVYIDAHPELLSVLDGDVKAGRFGDGWKIPEQTPPFRRYDDAGWLVSLNIRNLLADNEMLGLVGSEAYAPLKAAIRAAYRVGAGAGQNGTASSSSSSSSSSASAAASKGPASAPSRIIGFPLPMQHNNGETIDRPAQLGFMLVGNASTTSNALTALVGNPNNWFFGPAPQDSAANGAADVGAGGAASITAPAPLSSPTDVDFLVALPDTGYFTRSNVNGLQEQFRNAVDAACEKATAANCDVEADLLSRENRARAAGDASGAEAFAVRALTSQRQSAAIAFQLQTTLDEIAAVARGEEPVLEGRASTSSSRASSSSSSSSSSSASAPVGVAIVNLGGMGSLQRNWAEAHPPLDMFPPLSTAQVAIGYTIPVLGGGALLWGAFKAGQRYPKTTGVFGLIVAGSVGAIGYSAVYGDWTRYGSWVRGGLARPRVTSPLTKANK